MSKYVNDSLNIFQEISRYMIGEEYKTNDDYANIICLKSGLREYTLGKLNEYGYKFDSNGPKKIDLYTALKLLEMVLIKNGASEKDIDDYFYQYLNVTDYIVSALQDRVEPKLSIVPGKLLYLGRENDKITSIIIGNEIEPADRIISLLDSLKEEYKNEISK